MRRSTGASPSTSTNTRTPRWHTVSLRTPAGQDVTGVGQAQRNPLDPSVPEIGDELAVARALRNLAERLLHTTEKDIRGATGEPAHLRR